MGIAVHVSDPPEAEYIALLKKEAGGDVQISLGPELPAKAQYSILVSGRPSEAELTASERLEALVIPWAGLPVKTRELMLEYPQIAVHNLHYNGIATAEMAVTLMLAAAKFVIPMDRQLREGDWTLRYHGDPTLQLYGKTVLILGYGAIGRHVGKVCHGMGMRVVAVRRNAKAGPDGIAQVYSVDRLRELLPEADVVVVALPMTPETSGLIGKDELALLPGPVVLVNVGRGPVVDEAALYDALKARRLYSAGLDVWYEYPENGAIKNTMPSRYPFHELDNVVMSPHRGGDNSETEAIRMTCLAELLRAAAAGGRLPNRVDVARGY